MGLSASLVCCITMLHLAVVTLTHLVEDRVVGELIMLSFDMYFLYMVLCVSSFQPVGTRNLHFMEAYHV